MSPVLTLWNRLPTIVQAILAGVLVAAVGETPWVLLVGANIKLSPSLPWAVAAMGLWLYFYGKYFSGAGWPQSTRATRSECFRSLAMPRQTCLWSLLSGVLAVTSLVALEFIVLRLVPVAAGTPTQASGIPLYSLLPLAVMSAFASGIPEEVGFRGYMQVPLERRYGSALAILLVALVFTLAHLNHGLSIRLFFDFAFGIVFGVMAMLANSLLPGMALHCAADVILFVAGRRISAALISKPLSWTSGADLWFWLSSATFVVSGICAWLAFRQLAKIARMRPVPNRKKENPPAGVTGTAGPGIPG
jgi:membrane protease YdiL (CAAX protease family)